MSHLAILVPNIDLPLLRHQRDALLKMVDGVNMADRTVEEVNAIDGVVNLLDAMIDIAEG